MRLQREKADSRQAGPSLSGGPRLGHVEEEGEATLPWYQPRRSLSTGAAAPASAACAGSAPRERPPPVAKVFGQPTTTAAARAPEPAPAVALPWAASGGASTSAHIARQLSETSGDETGMSSSGHSPSVARTIHGESRLAGANGAALRPSPLGAPVMPAGKGGAFSFSGAPPAPTAPAAPTAPTAAQPSPLAPPLPLGYGAPLQGFDLGSFMRAVTSAVEPAVEPAPGAAAPTLERGSSGALNESDLHDLFEVRLARAPALLGLGRGRG